MAAYAALVSLMNNIEQIQRHNRLPIRFDKKQSESLLEKVNFLIDFLESYNFHGAGEKTIDFESRIRDEAYAAEDIIETHVVDTIHAYSISVKEENEMMYEKVSPTLSCLDKVIEDMEFIKEEAMKLKDKNETQYPMIGSSISFVPAGNSTTVTVGFDDEIKRLTERLLAREPSRQVIPVVGMGGMGKTTLARTAYMKPFIGKHFDFCAWVTISQEYDLKKIVLGLLAKEASQMSGNELGQRLHQTLYGRRYLIVLDDMWSVKAWEMVNVFLPDNNNGSRIIVTTRESSVSNCFGSSSLEMSFLDENQSWNLFSEKVFAAKSCPRELEEVGRNVVHNCKGLPLSIVVIGGLLAKSERRREYWEYIAENTTEIISSEDNEHCMKILSLSYQNLPVHLKPCFLYTGVFSEDEKIHASMLIKLWLAEGFLKSRCSKGLEVIGKEYLNDLISRNLIMVDRRGLNGKTKSCMIHDLLRYICLKEAKNEKFIYAQKLCSHDDLEFIGSQRRISFHNSSSSEKNISQILDTLKSGSMSRTFICNTQLEVLPLRNFRLLRVLSCINTRTYDIARYSLHNAFEQVNSRLITINYIPGPTPFPSSLCLLWNLQILIVTQMGENNVFAPSEIWEMTELRHLQFSWGLHLPEPLVSKQMNGQEGDITMKKLHTLKGLKDFRLGDEVVKRIPNIKKLSICYELNGKELEGCLKSLSLLENLESLRLSFEQQTRFDVISNLIFPDSLRKLTMIGSGLPWEDMSTIASLPHLEVLRLINKAFIGPKWELDEEVFCCLKYLEISYCPDLVHWIAEDMHFPCLEHLVLLLLDELEEIPSGIGDIPTLQRIELLECSKSAVISAKNILEEQENLGNMSLQIKVRCTEDAEIESLASENFQVRVGDE